MGLDTSAVASVVGNSTYRPGTYPAKNTYNGVGVSENTEAHASLPVSKRFADGFFGGGSQGTSLTEGGFGGGGSAMNASAGGGGGGWRGGNNGKRYSDGSGGAGYYNNASVAFVHGMADG